MYTRFQKITSIMLVFCFSSIFCGVQSFAENFSVKLVVNPNRTDIQAGADPIACTAQTSGANLKYTWKLNGPGKIDGTDLPAVFYIAPKEVSGKSAQAIITVVVTNETGQQVTESITFNILPPSEQKSAGMSKTTKIALGVGAAVALGGGIALLAGGGNDKGDDKETFTGSFKQEFNFQTDSGNMEFGTRVLNLIQSGNAINGTYVWTATLVDGATSANCCTASFTASIAGTVTGMSAFLSWGAAEGRCECEQWIFTPGTDAGSGGVTLINNGRTIRFEEGAEYIRMFIAGLTETNREVREQKIIPLKGEFIRQ